MFVSPQTSFKCPFEDTNEGGNLMKHLLIYLISFFAFRANAQKNVGLFVNADASYNKGYLSAVLTFQNHSQSDYFFSGNTLAATESMFPDTENINYYKRGALLFFIHDDEGRRVEWFGLPPITYKCKPQPEFKNFIVPPSDKFQVEVVVCLKMYESILKKGRKYSICFTIVQNDEHLAKKSNHEPFLGTLKSNSVFFVP